MATNELGPLLIELQRIIESSTVFRIAPHYERWQDGLESLDKARLELTAVKVGVEHLTNAPRALVHDVGQLHQLLEGFVDLRDHFRKQFPSGGDSQVWTELETAKRKLTQVQQLTDKIQLNMRSESYTTPQGAEPVMPWRWFLLGVFLLLVAVGFGVWAFQQRCMTTQQVALLRFFLPLAGGFAAWTFSGSITARARNLIPGVAIVAVGGGAVFVITTFAVLDPEKLKLDCTPPNVACSEQAPCVDVTRSMDFSAAGCEGDKPKDVLVIDDEWPAADSDDTALSFSSFFKLYRTDIPQRRMTARRIIEALDVIKHV